MELQWCNTVEENESSIVLSREEGFWTMTLCINVCLSRWRVACLVRFEPKPEAEDFTSASAFTFTFTY